MPRPPDDETRQAVAEHGEDLPGRSRGAWSPRSSGTHSGGLYPRTADEIINSCCVAWNWLAAETARSRSLCSLIPGWAVSVFNRVGYKVMARGSFEKVIG